MKKTKQLAWQFLGQEEVKQQRLAKQAPGEKKKKKNTIHDSGESFQSCLGYWNSIERISCVFMPHFWDPSFDFIFKMLISAC